MSLPRLRRLLALRPAERTVLVQAWLLFGLVDLGLRLLPFRRLLGLIERAPCARPDRPGPAEVERVAWLVDVAGRFAPRPPNCLTTALVLDWLLRRRGLAPILRIGVARQDGVFAAHAWLERDGQRLDGLADGEGYAALGPVTPPAGGAH